jgi:GxxExxY protein
MINMEEMISQKEINQIAYEIVGCAIEVHRYLGPGLLEVVYKKCLLEELNAKLLTVRTEVPVPISYKGKDIGSPLRLDMLVEGLIVVELKAVENMNPIFQAQLLTYLKLSGLPKGLLINFNCENITKNLIPIVSETFMKFPKE